MYARAFNLLTQCSEPIAGIFPWLRRLRHPQPILRMAELPVDTPLVAKDLDSSCVSCGNNAEEMLCLPCLHSVSVCEKKECREKTGEK